MKDQERPPIQLHADECQCFECQDARDALMASSDGGPAFPTMVKVGDVAKSSGGLSIRDYFAGQFAAGSSLDDSPLDVSQDALPDDVEAAMKANFDLVAKAAYMFADAMLKARKG